MDREGHFFFICFENVPPHLQNLKWTILDVHTYTYTHIPRVISVCSVFDMYTTMIATFTFIHHFLELL